MPQLQCLIGLGPVHIPDQVPFIVSVEPIMPFRLVREFDCEWLVVYNILSEGFVLHTRNFLVWPKLVDLGLHCWLHVSVQIPAYASSSIITWRRRSHKRTSVTALWVVFITPVIARWANLCNFWAPSCRQCVTLGHSTMQTCQCWSDHHGVDPVYHSGFQTTGFTKCTLEIQQAL